MMLMSDLRLPFVNSNRDRIPKQQREVAEAHERVLLLEECLKMQKAEEAEEAAAAAAAETHPPRKLARYRYPTMVKTLGNFRLHVVEGEITDSQIIVVLGKKGTGKTTFLRMLARTMKLSEISDGEMPKSNVSYKPQKLFQKNNPSQTVGYLLHHKIRDSCMNPEFVCNVMEPLHINLLLMDKLVKDLSPGQAQSVALCLCLGQPADIYLIDVPSAYLEPEQRVATARVIKWFIRHEKKAAVVVEDDFIMAFQLAHGYIVIEGQPFVDCTANGPVSVLAGANLYLSQLNNPVQRAPVELCLDLKKLESITERREQKAAGSSSYYCDEISGEI